MRISDWSSDVCSSDLVFPQWQPQSRTNYGELINPARPAPDDLRLQTADGKQVGVEALRQRWTYLYVGGESCEQACQDKLYQSRQIRIRLNDKRSRVQRVYLAPDAAALQALKQIGRASCRERVCQYV